MNVRRYSVVLLLCFAFVAQVASAASPNVVISQVYGGGGASTGSPTYKNDYVELFNTSSSPVSLTGYSVQYGSAAGNFSSVYIIQAGTSIPAGGYLFIQVSSAGSAGNNFPITPDLTTTALSMSAASGKVALANVTAALGCGTTPCAPTDTRIVDLVAYGAANNAEGGASAGNGVAFANTQGAVRNQSGCQDTDNNNADFTVVSGPVPRNSASPTHPCGVVTNNPPSITAPANPITTVTQDAAPFTVALSGADDGNIFNWSATAGAGVQNVSVSGGQGTANVLYTITLVAGFNGTASFTASLSDNVNAPVSRTVNIQVNPPAVNNPPTITAPANPIITVTRDAAPFTVNLTGSDDHSIYNWSATAGTGISSVTVTGASAATFTVTLTSGFVGTASFTASLSDSVNAPVTQAVNILVNLPALPAGTIVISQIYGGGGNAGSTLQNDFIELFNRSSSPVSLDGWSVQHFSSSNPSWFATPLTGVIQPHSYYLVQEAAGTTPGGGTVPLPTPDAIGTIGLSSTAGTVALTKSTTLLSGDICATSSDLVDWVGYGTGSSCSGRVAIGGLSNTIAASRRLGGCIYTPSATDFFLAPPAPRNSASPINDCSTVTEVFTPHVMISQLYGGGGNSGATFTNDFVELYNPTDADVSLEGWSIQYTSSTGNTWASNSQPLGGSIPTHGYFLIELAGGTNGASLPPPRIIGDINMSQTSGKLALVKNFTPLTGNCPIGNPMLVDFIGYGTADCFEGGLPAPGLSSSKADIRATNSDTDQNSVDFTAVTPTTPRGTGELVELPPLVSSTEPATTNAPFDSTVTINFSEPVNVGDGWFSISCTSTGPHTDVQITSAFGGRTWAITPNVTFTPGEQCTVNVFKDAVTDVDTNDGPNTDHMPTDFQFTFTVATAVVLPYPPDVHLTFGNPSAAIADTRVPNNYLMSKPQYALSYNRDLGRPNWVSWHLTDEWFGSITRVDTFRPDPVVPSDWYRVQAFDFASSGFDRGHMCPNADRDSTVPTMQSTFLMSNMVAQSPGNNQGPWADLEGFLRTLASSGDELYVVSGPAGVGGSGDNGVLVTTVANGHVTVPAYTWKVALFLTKDSGNDVARVTASTPTIAVIMPNTNIRGADWHNYLTTVRAVETLTGYNFFSNVPQTIQNAIEAGVNGDNPPGVGDESVSTPEDTAKTITLDVASPNNAPVTYTIVTTPLHGTLAGSDVTRTYTPAPDFNGTDTFTYRVSDGTHTSNTGTVTITVLEVNDPPTATDDSKNTDEDTALSFAAGDLTTNDTTGPANESTQTLTVTSVAATSDTHGTATLNAGQVSYAPEANYNGAASFTYTVCDNGVTSGLTDAQCATATVHVAIAPVNDPPAPSISVVPTSAEGSAVLASASVSDPDAGESFTYAWSVTKNGAPYFSASSTTFSFTPNDNGSYVVSVIVTDRAGATGHDSKTVIVTNVAPTITSVSLSAATIDENGTATLSGTFTDPGDDTHTVTINWGDGSVVSPVTLTHGSRMFTVSHQYLDDAPSGTSSDAYAISFTVADNDGGVASGTSSITVNNVAPVITSVSGPTAPLPLGSVASINVRYTDVGSLDTHTALFSWDDGSTSVAACAAGLCTASHTFVATGVYGVAITLSDDDAGIASAKFAYVVVTDANAGFVTGGGWITSPTGKVSFSFNSKYQMNQTTPSGNVELQGASFNFNSTAMDWLVVAGSNAQFAGTGTVNGTGSYGYVLTAVDSAVDKFRFRIWDKTSGATVYDNVPGASDDIDEANPQPIGNGSIVIH